MNSKRVIAVIPARGGSKSLPRKNLLLAGGRPLIAWTILAAQKSNAIDYLALSSEDSEIIAVAEAWGCSAPFRRPDELSTDTASTIDVVLHALEQLPGYDYVILLQPTSPLRTEYDIDKAFALLEATGAPSCVSICEVDKSPYLMYLLGNDKTITSVMPQLPTLMRRQDLPATYVLNGAIYIANVDWLRKNKKFITSETVAYEMDRERSIDIDTKEDLEYFRTYVEIRDY